MMRNLLLEEGSIVYLENISLPVATYAKFEPQSTEFLDITNPKAVYPLFCVARKYRFWGKASLNTKHSCEFDHKCVSAVPW